LNIKNYLLLIGILGILSILSCTSGKVLLAPTAHDQFDLAKKDFDDGKYLKAIEGFQKTIFNFPGATIVDTAQYYLAMSYFKNDEYELAAVEFNRLILSYPRSKFADDAQYMVGVSYIENSPGHYALDQEDLRKAIKSLQDFIIDNPDSPLIDDARDRIKEARNKLAHKAYQNGITYYKMYAYGASEVYFQYVIDEYTDTPYAAKALFKYAEALYKEHKYRESQEKFNQFVGLYPDHKLIDKVNDYLRKTADKIPEENVSADTN